MDLYAAVRAELKPGILADSVLYLYYNGDGPTDNPERVLAMCGRIAVHADGMNAAAPRSCSSSANSRSTMGPLGCVLADQGANERTGTLRAAVCFHSEDRCHFAANRAC
jgi:hypothetical protein